MTARTPTIPRPADDHQVPQPLVIPWIDFTDDERALLESLTPEQSLVVAEGAAEYARAKIAEIRARRP